MAFYSEPKSAINRNTTYEASDEGLLEPKPNANNRPIPLLDLARELVIQVRRTQRFHDRIESIVHGKTTEPHKSAPLPSNVVSLLSVAINELGLLNICVSGFLERIDSDMQKNIDMGKTAQTSSDF